MDQVVVYRPDTRYKMGSFQILLFALNRIWHSRQLVWVLYRRDVLNFDKRTFLGMAWLFLTPLITMLCWIFMNSAGLLNPGAMKVPYPVFALVGSACWALFFSSYSLTTASFDSATGFINQVNFPHEVLVAKQAIQALTHFAITCLITLIVMLIFGFLPSWQTILAIPLLLPLFLAGISVGLVTSVFTIVVPDLKRIIDLLMGFLLFLSPVFYSVRSGDGLLAKMQWWNPLSYLICLPRDLALLGESSLWLAFAVDAAVLVVLFLLSVRFFYVSEYRIIEKII